MGLEFGMKRVGLDARIGNWESWGLSYCWGELGLEFRLNELELGRIGVGIRFRFG